MPSITNPTLIACYFAVGAGLAASVVYHITAHRKWRDHIGSRWYSLFGSRPPVAMIAFTLALVALVFWPLAALVALSDKWEARR